MAAAGAASIGWLIFANGAATTLAQTGWFDGLNHRLAPSLPLLFGMGVMLYLMSVSFHYVVLTQQAGREAERRETEAMMLARDAELRALRAQLSPHFLFNSLNSISALATSDGASARRMCLRLADFLRSTLGMSDRAVVTLPEELDLVRSYLDVEMIRFGTRLRTEERIETEGPWLLPPLILQPLVENAVRHGVGRMVEDAYLRVEVSRDGPWLVAAVENAYDPDSALRPGTGMGVGNVRKRLAARYGDRFALNIRHSGGVHRVELRIPAEQQEEHG